MLLFCGRFALKGAGYYVCRSKFAHFMSSCPSMVTQHKHFRSVSLTSYVSFVRNFEKQLSYLTTKDNKLVILKLYRSFRFIDIFNPYMQLTVNTITNKTGCNYVVLIT